MASARGGGVPVSGKSEGARDGAGAMGPGSLVRGFSGVYAEGNGNLAQDLERRNDMTQLTFWKDQPAGSVKTRL